MGLLLIGGTIVLGAVVWQKLSADPAAAAYACPGGHIDLKGRGFIMESKNEDSMLRLMLEKAPGQLEIIHIDTCNGRITHSFRLETDPVMAVE